jgi:hypothetical protein
MQASREQQQEHGISLPPTHFPANHLQKDWKMKFKFQKREKKTESKSERKRTRNSICENGKEDRIQIRTQENKKFHMWVDAEINVYLRL